jgi:hypothetical protein
MANSALAPAEPRDVDRAEYLVTDRDARDIGTHPGGSDCDAHFSPARVRLGKRTDEEHLGRTEPVKLDGEHAHLCDLDNIDHALP